MLVVVCGTRLAQILNGPWLLFSGLDIRLWADPCETAQDTESHVWACSSAREHRGVRVRVIWHDTSDVRMNRAIHGPVEGLSRLDLPVEDPSPTRTLFDFAVRGLWFPRHVPPTDRFVGWNTLPYRSRTEAAVEDYDKRSPPEAPDGERLIPTSRPLHSVRCEIEGVDFGLGEVVFAGNTSLRFMGRMWNVDAGYSRYDFLEYS